MANGAGCALCHRQESADAQTLEEREIVRAYALAILSMEFSYDHGISPRARSIPIGGLYTEPPHWRPIRTMADIRPGQHFAFGFAMWFDEPLTGRGHDAELADRADPQS